ncbi:MAG: hypothetical protein HY287_07735 [Planctomycetes bacterium]|nr:hypothetical protein [Planctomycetota bacterium]MBI3834202.1 hypothetical protein [Planctomycetota bacterium]
MSFRLQQQQVCPPSAFFTVNDRVSFPRGWRRIGTITLWTCLVCASTVHGECGQWADGFGLPGLEPDVSAMTVYDDGTGPALYAPYGDHYVTNFGGIAKWNGVNWSPVADGIGGVWALSVFDDGTGPALYAGGEFNYASGVSANNIAKWNGSTWSALGAGMDGPVRALTVFDDGTGPALYAGGDFLTAGGITANYIAKWNGSTWTSLGSGVSGSGGINPTVFALAVFDAGTGPALYIGGGFPAAGGVSAANIAKWNGSTWSPLGSGMSGGDLVFALTVFNDGTGPALYAGGQFTVAGGLSAGYIAKWRNSQWSALGSGMDNYVVALAAFDDGTGPGLYAGGAFTTAGGASANRIAKWSGSTWSALGSGTDPGVESFAIYNDGSGLKLYAGGGFSTAGGVVVNHIAKWNGTTWSALNPGSGIGGNESTNVLALTVYNDGTGPALYAGGDFSAAGTTIATNIAKWNGSSWSALGSGVGRSAYNIAGEGARAIAAFDDGTGPALYAGGDFTTVGGASVSHIAKWNGSTWSPLGAGLGGPVSAIAAFNDGTGPALYAGGQFIFSGTTSVHNIAKWNGSTWSEIGGTGIGGFGDYVNAITIFDDGSGPSLYAGAEYFNHGAVFKWNGSAWSTLGSAFIQPGGGSGVLALTVFDDGSGPTLYAGGTFATVGGITVNNIAKWNGSHWSALGSGLAGNGVYALAVLDYGAGPALYAGGGFSPGTGAPVTGIAKWNGSTWSALGSGVGGANALAVFDDGAGPILFVGGGFHVAGGKSSVRIAAWRPASGDCNGNGICDPCDIDCNALLPDPCPVGCGMSNDCNLNGLPDECDITSSTSQDCNANSVPDECESGCVSAGAQNVDNGQTVTLDPGGGTSDPTQNAQVSFTNASGTNGASVTVTQTTDPVHPDAGGYAVLGKSLVLTTSLANGGFFARVVVPFDAASLGGADPLALDLAWYDAITGVWMPAAAGNTQNSPSHNSRLGDRFAVADVNTPSLDLLSSDLGDYGVFWNTATLMGFVWTNVDHASAFAPGIVARPNSDVSGINKTRFISFSITSASETAIRVTLTSLHHPDPPNLPQFPSPNFSAFEGRVRYVGPPSNCQETESPPTTFKCAVLQCAPYYTNWDAALGGQTLHLRGAEIVPSSAYDIQQLAASCQGVEASCTAVSAALSVNTGRWGDIAAPFQAPSPAALTQPNITDVSACVDKFKSVATAIIVARADVNPAVPNERVDIADVANIVDAFKNLAYPFPGPTACP